MINAMRTNFVPFARVVVVVLFTAIAQVTVAPAETVTVGPVSVNVMVEPEQPIIGDVVTLSIKVAAEPEVEVLMPEFGEALDRFAIVDFIPRETIDERGASTATQEYRLQPTSSGRQSIPPILVEFVDRRPGQRLAPDGQDAYEILTPRLDFEVQSVVPAGANNHLKPPLGELVLKTGGTRSWWSLWLVGAGLGAVAVVATVLLRAKRQPISVSAYEIARARLSALRQRPIPAGEALDPFFVELSDTVRTYLEQRFDLRAPELTTEEFLEVAAESPDLSRTHQQTLRVFLHQADLVKFAGHQPTEGDVRAALQAAGDFIEETRDTPSDA